MKTFSILGLSGSPRQGNTDFLLDLALASAQAQGDISAEKVLLRDLSIEFCKGCFKCFDSNPNEFACQIHRDSMDQLYPKLKGCDGLILATPVYFGQVTAQMKAFMDRTEPLLRYAKGLWKLSLRNKVGGAVVVGGNRHGGQETTIQAIHHFFLIHDMIVVGTGPDERPGCYLGAAATTHPRRGRDRDGAKKDSLGAEAARILGRRVAEVVRQFDKTPL